MDRATLEAHFWQAEVHVAKGERAIESQKRIAAGLARDGHDSRAAYALLELFEQTQALHVADRDRLRREMEAFKETGSQQAPNSGTSRQDHLI